MTSAVIADARAPEAIKAVADAGHEVLSHCICHGRGAGAASPTTRRKRTSARCTALLEKASGKPVRGWLSRAGTSRSETPRPGSPRPAIAGMATCSDDDLPYVLDFGEQESWSRFRSGTDVNDMPSMKYRQTRRDMMLTSFNENVKIARSRKNELC